MKANQSCGTCAHCDHEGNDLSTGICRYDPPMVTLLPKPGPVPGTLSLQKVSSYPPVTLKDKGCSHYTPALEVLADA